MRILMLVLPLVLVCGCAKEPSIAPGVVSLPETISDAQGKRAVMIVAHGDFRDEELLEPRRVLEEAGVEVTIASSSLSAATGVLGATVVPDILLDQVAPTDYDAVIFVGGPGAAEYWDDVEAHGIAREALAADKIVGAICVAPVTLANAGVLQGKRATVWRSEAERLRAGGAEHTGRDVEVDGRIITASGPEAAEAFGRAVLGALAE